MSIRRTPLSDDRIEALLLARSADADGALIEDILTAAERLEQRRSGWLARPLDRRMLSLLSVALLLATLAGALALAARFLPPDLDLDPPPGPEGGWILYINSNGDPFLSDLQGGEPQPIERPRGSMRCPSFSPDGRLLAFSEERRSGDSGRFDVVVAALGNDGTLATRLQVESSVLCPKWSRDGRLAIGTQVLTLHAACPVGPSCEASPRVRVRFPTPIEEHLDWRYDGSELLVLTRDGAVLAGPLDGGPARRLYELASDDRRLDFITDFVASPAAPYLAMAGTSASRGTGVFEEATVRVIDMEGNVIFEEARDFNLEGGTISWSPDGFRLAWPDPDGIKILSIDRPGETTLLRLPPIPRPGWGDVEDVGVSGLAWSPDGRRLLLNVAHGDDAPIHAHAIVSVPVDGSADVVLHSEWTGALEVWGGMSWQSR